MDSIVNFLKNEITRLFTESGREMLFPPDELDEASDLLYDIGMDSLDIVELLAAIEDRYGYYLPDDQLIKMKTLGDLAENILHRPHID